MLAYVAASVFGAWWTHRKLGDSGYVLGAMGGIIVFHFLRDLAVYLVQMGWQGRPPLPDCRSGRCGQRDYFIDDSQSEVTLLCRCGHRYRRKGMRFLEVLPDGAEKPFLRWRPFRGWFADF